MTKFEVMPEEVEDLTPIPKDKKIDDTALICFFEEVWAVADEARAPRKRVWEQAWDLYNGRMDWTGKAEWQSRIPIAKVRGAVDRAAATFRRALVRMKNFYAIQSESQLGLQKGLFTKALMDMWLDQANFIEEFTTALKSGLITSSLIMKVFWHYKEIPDLSVETTEIDAPTFEYGMETETEKRSVKKPKIGKKIYGCLGLKAVDPFKFWIVPGAGGAYIERTETTLADLYDLADRGIYKKSAIEEIEAAAMGGLNDGDSNPSESVRKGEQITSGTKHIREVILYHYWGDIFDEDGKVVMRDATFTVAGDHAGKAHAVLRDARTNPFFHGRSPYVVGTPYVVPFSTYNRGLVEDVIGIAHMITELSNLISDGAMFDAIKAFEVDVDLLHNPADVANGIYPGLALRKKGLNDPTGQKHVVRAIDVGKIPNEALNALNMFEREFQAGTMITELVSGGPGGGSRRTATEVQSKTSQALEGLDDAARTVEETFLNPMLELTAKTIYQFHDDYTMERLMEEFPKVSLLMRRLEPAERYVVMFGNTGLDAFNFRARGISIMMDKQQNLEKVQQLMTLGANIPGFLEQLNAPAVAEEVVTGLGWNPQKILVKQPSGVTAANQKETGQPFPGPGDQNTPAQENAAQAGAAYGGATNNPMAPGVA